MITTMGGGEKRQTLRCWKEGGDGGWRGTKHGNEGWVGLDGCAFLDGFWQDTPIVYSWYFR